MKKRHLLNNLWLSAFLLAATVAGASRAQFAGGTGEPNTPYRIATAKQLIALGQDPNLWEKHFVLVRDLDMKGVDPNAMKPIGNGAGEPFLGVFDGNGHTISGLRIIGKDDSCVGLFGVVGTNAILISPDSRKGHVRNLHLKDIQVQGYSSVGGLAGELGAGTISHCSVTGAVKASSLVGGLIGWAHSEVEHCRTLVNVSGDEKVGGLIGTAQAGVTRCSSSGRVTGRSQVGGLIGSTFATGFVGMMELPERDAIEYERIVQCRSDCEVVGKETVGGLIGFASAGGEILDCYATGRVQGSIDVGGLIGVASGCSVIRCFSVGQITGQEHVGGFIGENMSLEDVGIFIGKDMSPEGTERLARYPPCRLIVEELPSSDGEPKWLHVYRPAILSCFWEGEASRMARGLGSGADAQGGLSRLTTAQIRTAASFRNFGWDFESIWTIREGENHPRLRWEQQSPINPR